MVNDSVKPNKVMYVLVLYSTVINAFATMGKTEEAIGGFETMVNDGVKADEVTYSTCIRVRRFTGTRHTISVQCMYK